MNYYEKNFFRIGTAVFTSALLLSACGDEVTEVNNITIGMRIIENEDSLMECTSENEGEQVWIKSISAAKICVDSEWALIGEKASSSKLDCEAKPLSNKNGVAIYCDGDSIGVVLNGEKGENGNDGYSCNAKQNEDKTVTTITCKTADGDVSYEVKNGTNGDDGKSACALALGKESCTDVEVTEWVASLKGDNGNDGKSACALALGKESCTDAEVAEWIVSLKGDKGEDGVGCQIKSSTETSVTITCGNDEVTLLLPDVSKLISSSSQTIARSSSSIKLSSSSNVIAYTTECPAGKTCTYAPTEQLNSAKTYGELLDDRDYQVYKTIEICGDNNEKCQTWMAQNLNYNYNNGTAKSFCFNNEPSNCDTYGRLYLWSAAMDSAAMFSTAGKGCGNGNTCGASGNIRGVCPVGWHLPSDEEWNELNKYVGYNRDRLASISGWKSKFSANSYGFSALPAGYYQIFSSGKEEFGSLGGTAYFFSSKENNSEKIGEMAYFVSISGSASSTSILGSGVKWGGLSVRCLKD